MAGGDGSLGPDSATALAHAVHRRLTWTGVVGNGLGALVVMGFLVFLAPRTVVDDQAVLERGIPLLIAFMAVALPLGWHVVNRRPYLPIRHWLETAHPATDTERRLVLRYPLTWALGSGPARDRGRRADHGGDPPSPGTGRGRVDRAARDAAEGQE